MAKTFLAAKSRGAHLLKDRVFSKVFTLRIFMFRQFV